MELIFSVEKQVMARTDSLVIASHSRKVHSCSFTFSEEWADMEKSATFKKNHITYDVLLDNNTCTIPSEVLRSAGAFEVGVYGSDGQRTITSNLVSVEVVAGSPTEGVESRITPSLFEQIIKKINEVKKGEVEPELILEAVNEYLTEHPLNDIVVDEVAAYVTEHASELKGDKGDKGDRGEKGEQGIQGIQGERGEQGLKGDKGDKGEKGDTGATGAQGIQGIQGIQGEKGDTGAVGKSAYQIAVDNGFSGTEAEWLASLKGEKGERGEQGIRGEKGDTGEKGDKGDKGDAGATYDDTEIKSEINDIWKVQGELGAKNLIPYPYNAMVTNPIVTQGLTYTSQEDGGLNVDGTTTAYSWIPVANMAEGYWKQGQYIMSIGADDVPNAFYLQLIDTVTSGNICSIRGGTSKLPFTITPAIESHSTQLRIVVPTMGSTIDNLTIYPMVRMASDTDDTWQPYAPTNYQLNQKLDTIAGVYLPNATNTSSKKVVASVGQTSVTFDATSFMSRYNVTASDLDLDISAETASGDIVSYNNVSVTGGIVTVTFDALAEQTTFICKCSVIQ